MGIKCPKCKFENPDDAVYCGKCTTPLRPEEISVPTETLEIPKEELTTNSTFAGRYQIIEDLSRVILRYREKEKEKRYKSAGEVRSELENIEKGILTTEYMGSVLHTDTLLCLK